MHADEREIFTTTKEDLEHGIAGQMECLGSCPFLYPKSSNNTRSCHYLYFRVTTGMNSSGVFLPLRMFLGLALNCSHFDAAKLDRLNIHGPLHFQTGVLFETLQTFSSSGLRAITAVLVSRSPPAHRRSDRVHRRVERRDDAHGTPHRLHDVAR